MRPMLLLTPLALCAVLLWVPLAARADGVDGSPGAGVEAAAPVASVAAPAASAVETDADADEAESDADAAESDAEAAESDAEAAESDADAAISDAEAAESDADAAISDAESAESDVDAAVDAADEDMPWPDDTELTPVGNEGYDYTVMMPAGGEYLAFEDLGIDTAGDPMAYPFIWRHDDASPLFFDMIMLGVVHDTAAIDDARFAALVAAQHANLLADYPDGTLQAEPIATSDADEYGWTMGVYPAADGSKEVTTFSTYDGSDFYTFFFYGRPGWGATETVWAQMMHIVDSFELQ